MAVPRECNTTTTPYRSFPRYPIWYVQGRWIISSDYRVYRLL